MAHVINLVLGAFMTSYGVIGCSKSWEAHEYHQQFREIQGIDIGHSERPQNESIVRIYQLSAMRPGLTKINENVYISSNFESSNTYRHMAANDCCIHYTNTRSS